jgi:hypothetical protein
MTSANPGEDDRAARHGPDPDDTRPDNTPDNAGDTRPDSDHDTGGGDAKRAVWVVLAGLGATPKAIAGALRRAGITGCLASCDHCPIAHYLFLHTDADEVAVSREEICVWWPGGAAMTATPAPVAEFIAGFDSGAFPHLIDTSAQQATLADPGTPRGTEDRS